MSNGLDPQNLCPAASEREFLLYTVFGTTEPFGHIHDRQPAGHESTRQQTALNSEDKKLQKYRRQLLTLMTSMAQQRPKLAPLFPRPVPRPSPPKPQPKRSRRHPPQVSCATKKRKKDAVGCQGTSTQAPVAATKDTATNNPPSGQMQSGTNNDGTTARASTETSTAREPDHGGRENAWHLAPLPVFSVSLLSGVYISAEFRETLIAQCTNSKVPEPSGSSKNFAVNCRSPLSSIPGLISDTKLLYRAEGRVDPYSWKWANKINSHLPLCSMELLKGRCNRPKCNLQHKRDWQLSEAELLHHARVVGEDDRRLLNGEKNVAVLRWPTKLQKHCFPTDDIPVYSRDKALPGHVLSDPSLQKQSCLLRSLQCDKPELCRRDLQLSMDFSLNRASIASTPSTQLIRRQSQTTSGSPREDSETQDEVEILSAALSMLEGGCFLEQSSRECAMKYLSKKLAIYPHYRLVWQLYLALFLRDESESQQYKQHQAQLCQSLHGPWYRKSLMVAAAICPTSAEKIAVYKKTIHDLSQKETSVPLPSTTLVCCLDLALRIIHLELATIHNPFAVNSTACSQIIASVRALRENHSCLPTDCAWIYLLYTLPEQLYVLCYSIIHARLHGELPVSTLFAFGFPKRLQFLKWKRTVPSERELEDVMLLLSWAVRPLPVVKDFFQTPDQSIELKRMCVGNLLLLFHSCRVAGPVKKIKALFPTVAKLQNLPKFSENLWLEIAEMMDTLIDSGSPGVERGVVLEQMLAKLVTTDPVGLWTPWIKKLCQKESSYSYQVLLATRKALVTIADHTTETPDQSRQELLAMLDLLEGAETGQDVNGSGTPACESFFRCMSQLYSSVVKQEKIDFGSFVLNVSNLAQQDPALSQRLWMEMIGLAVAALPRDDPRLLVPTPGHIEMERRYPKSLRMDTKEEVLLKDMANYISCRRASFSVVMTLLRSFCKEHIHSVEALDNFEEEDLSRLPTDIGKILEAPQKQECGVLMELLYSLLPALGDHEIIEVIRFLFEVIPSAPEMVEFLLDVMEQRQMTSPRLIRMLFTALFHSVPSPGSQTWKRAASMGHSLGGNLGDYLDSVTGELIP